MLRPVGERRGGVGSKDNRLLTWRATTTELVGEWKHSDWLCSVAELGESMIAVCDFIGDLMVLSHQSASHFQVHRRLEVSHSYWVNHIVVRGALFVTSSKEKTVKVWDTNSLSLRAGLPHDDQVNSAAVSDRYIVTARVGPKISVFRNAPGYNLLFHLPLSEPEYQIGQAAFLNDDVVAVPSGHYLNFISLPTKSVLSRDRVGLVLYSFTVLSDGRIAVGGGYYDDGYCAISTLPKSVQGAIEDCVDSLYPPPLRLAWRAVQGGQLNLAEACRTVITSKICSTSLEVWCVARDLLMDGIKRGEIPASRDLGNSITHWHEVLYQRRTRTR